MFLVMQTVEECGKKSSEELDFQGANDIPSKQ